MHTASDPFLFKKQIFKASKIEGDNIKWKGTKIELILLLFSNHKLALHISNKKILIVNLQTIYVLFN